MKKTILWLLLLVSGSFFLAGCESTEVDNRFLVQIDTLLTNYQNDSAQALLEDIRPFQLSTDRDEAYYLLLREQSAYQNMLPATSDSLINHCISYYEQSGEDEVKLTRAYFYKGAIQKKLGELDQAILTLKKCEELAQKHKNLEVLCRVYQMLAAVNSTSNEYELCLEMSRKYLECALQIEKVDWRLSAYNQMAVAFEGLGQNDSAVHYINKCIPYLDKRSKGKTFARVFSNVGYFNRYRNPKFALKYLKISLEMVPTAATYDNLGCVYGLMGDEAMADSMWAEGLKIANLNRKVDLATSIIKHKREIGDEKTAKEFALKLVTWKDSLTEKQKTDKVERVQANYDFEKEMGAKDMQLEKLAGLVGLGMVILVFVAYYVKKRWTHDITQYSTEISELKKKDEESSHRAKEQTKYIERLSQDRHESIEKGQTLYDALERKETIVMWKDDDFESFFTYYFTKNTAFMTSLNADYTKLSNLMKLYLILVHEEWDNKDIANTLGVKVASLRVIKKRVRDKMKTAEEKE